MFLKSVKTSPVSKALMPPPSNHTPLLTLVWLKDNRRDQDAAESSRKCFDTHVAPTG